MKKLILLCGLLLLASCDEHEYRHIGQEVIDGKVSMTKEGISTGRYAVLPKIWVQTPTTTREVDIPFDYEGKWKVGDNCLLIIEKYEQVKTEK